MNNNNNAGTRKAVFHVWFELIILLDNWKYGRIRSNSYVDDKIVLT